MIVGINQLVGLEQVVHTADGNILVRLEVEAKDYIESLSPPVIHS